MNGGSWVFPNGKAAAAAGQALTRQGLFPVFQHVYHLKQAFANLNVSLQRMFGCGLFHSGIQVGAIEYSYGDGCGVASMSPLDVDEHIYWKTSLLDRA